MVARKQRSVTRWAVYTCCCQAQYVRLRIMHHPSTTESCTVIALLLCRSLAMAGNSGRVALALAAVLLALWIAPCPARDVPSIVNTSPLEKPAILVANGDRRKLLGGGQCCEDNGSCLACVGCSCNRQICKTYDCGSGYYLRCSPPSCFANSRTIVTNPGGVISRGVSDWFGK